MDNKNLSTQLGYYIGEYIMYRYLPSLSCDGTHCSNIIKVSEEEEEEYKRLSDAHFQVSMAEYVGGVKQETKTEWNNYQDYRTKLIEKYIPEKLECHLPILEQENLDIQLFKEAVGISLWDSDMSHYGCDPDNIEIIITGDKYDFPMIVLTRELPDSKIK